MLAKLTIGFLHELVHFQFLRIGFFIFERFFRRDSMTQKVFNTLLFTVCFGSIFGQSAGSLVKQLEKLNSFQRVMYIAAHPDDENTRVLAYLSKGRSVDVRYLSLTRGDGGQNMIGEELGAELGILRSQELLAARRIDGGSQVFSRAVDFGYSKSAKETMSKWDHDEVLGDVIRALRSFRPDVIITRFPPDSRGGHGHHTASAMLALEAFEMVGDSTKYPEQLQTLSTWQPKSIYWNTYSWRWDPNLDSLVLNDPNYIKTDIGGYDPWLGQSYNEIGSYARSQHKCQGFGVQIDRGSTWEYFQYLDGEKVESDLLEGIHRDWRTLGASEELIQAISTLNQEFDPSVPSINVRNLLNVRLFVERDLKGFWQKEKLNQIDELIRGCAGLVVEVLANDWSVKSGDFYTAKARVLSRQLDHLQIEEISWEKDSYQLNDTVKLVVNQFFECDLKNLHAPVRISQPYWLERDFTSSYYVEDVALIGQPENPPICEVEFVFNYEGLRFPIQVPIVYKWSDRVDGELIRPFVITPRATATFEEDVYVFPSRESKQVKLKIKSFDENLSTSIRLEVPEGWSVFPEKVDVDFSAKYQEKVVTFTVNPSEEGSEGFMVPHIDFILDPIQSYNEISYSHIPTQVVFGASKAKAVRLDLVIDQGTIGYIQGAGDQVDVGIQQMGFSLIHLSEEDLINEDHLNKYQAIVVGVRAYNVNPWLKNYHQKLMDYVANGGNLVVQYNTASRDLTTSEMGPYPFTISRERVTEEDARARIIDPTHPFFNAPNKIHSEDFDNWVQERGLYFTTDWDSHYQALISWHDEDEPARIGGLIFTPYGTGSFTYTGISFFRQLPAGVPGAFRLLANILSYE